MVGQSQVGPDWSLPSGYLIVRVSLGIVNETPSWKPRLRVALCSAFCYSYRMSRVIAQRELRNQNAQILAAVAAGATFVVTRNGTPVAELRPLPGGKRPFVSRSEIAAVAAQGPHIDAAAFRRDIDSAIEQGLGD